MNTKNETEKPSETREARPSSPGADPYEPEAAPSKDGSDFRETAERGYGWGV